MTAKTKSPAQGNAQQPSKASTKPTSPRPDSKIGNVVALLQSAKGATLEELTKATGWLPHTTRAALTGLKKRGYQVERLSKDGTSFYRIIEEA